jgi:hypothetical protein
MDNSTPLSLYLRERTPKCAQKCLTDRRGSFLIRAAAGKTALKAYYSPSKYEILAAKH